MGLEKQFKIFSVCEKMCRKVYKLQTTTKNMVGRKDLSHLSQTFQGRSHSLNGVIPISKTHISWSRRWIFLCSIDVSINLRRLFYVRWHAINLPCTEFVSICRVKRVINVILMINSWRMCARNLCGKCIRIDEIMVCFVLGWSLALIIRKAKFHQLIALILLRVWWICLTTIDKCRKFVCKISMWALYKCAKRCDMRETCTTTIIRPEVKDIAAKQKL